MARPKLLTEEDIDSFFQSLVNHGELSGVYKKLNDMRNATEDESNGESNGRKPARISLTHYFMELLVCDYLISNGCAMVDVERPLGNDTKYTKSRNLVIDVYGKSSTETVGVEIETGHIPNNILKPVLSNAARTIAKVTSYSPSVDYFSLAFPPTYKPALPWFFFRSPEERESGHLALAKRITDGFYTNPPFGPEDFLRARLDSVLIINMDNRRITEVRRYSSLREHFETRLEYYANLRRA